MTEENEKIITVAEQIQGLESKLLEISGQLKASDYIVLKSLDGENVDKYGDYHAERRELRRQYNQIETELAELKEEQDQNEI